MHSSVGVDMNSSAGLLWTTPSWFPGSWWTVQMIQGLSIDDIKLAQHHTFWIGNTRDGQSWLWLAFLVQVSSRWVRSTTYPGVSGICATSSTRSATGCVVHRFPQHVPLVMMRPVTLMAQSMGRLDESVKILVHAFVMARVDYCNRILAGAPRSVTDKLQRVLNAAARTAVCSSMTMDWRGFCMLTCTGSMWQIGFNTS